MHSYSTTFVKVIFVAFVLFVFSPGLVKSHEGHNHDRDISLSLDIPLTATQSASPAATPEYTLPYPGILPTHPMYWLKTIRDQIIENLIRDPVKKAEFYILQADKFLQSATMLDQSRNAQLVDRMVALSLANRQAAYDQLAAYENTGSAAPTHVVEKLLFSAAKHAQVLVDLGKDPATIYTLLNQARTHFYQSPDR